MDRSQSATVQPAVLTDQLAPKTYGLGLDLGQASDFTALILHERTMRPTGEFVATGESELVFPNGIGSASAAALGHVRPITREKTESSYGVVRIDRMREVSYVDVVAFVRRVVQALPSGCPAFLAVDYGGVGAPVLDMIVRANLGIPLVAVQIATSAMSHARRDPERPWRWVVPKRELAAVMHLLLQGDRWRCSPKLEHAKTLRSEMENFRMKITAHANLQFEADAREGAHDDMVLASAIACWAGERAIGQGGVL